ncbi:hypothetical protein NDU88_002970 [Pleurodeles waltl]|uniref:Uncharacterized protein n=1 Tax=Pleurodeles waltl TaxID=8319 RepID=A0AAV7PCF7_PLEWA|nr:hypothetical protein NDU88_002970 [Pleurodeles waltl]
MAGPQGHKGSPGALTSGGQRTKSRTRAPELKPEGEATPGQVDSQGRTPGDTAGWRKGVPAPGPGVGPAGTP